MLKKKEQQLSEQKIEFAKATHTLQAEVNALRIELQSAEKRLAAECAARERSAILSLWHRRTDTHTDAEAGTSTGISAMRDVCGYVLS